MFSHKVCLTSCAHKWCRCLKCHRCSVSSIKAEPKGRSFSCSWSVLEMIVLLALLALAEAHNGTCPSTKKCGSGAGTEAGLPCCQIDSSTFECCSSSEACIPKVGCRCQTLRQHDDYSFEQFCKEFVKSYADEEIAHRRAVFQANLEKIKAHNAEYEAGIHSWHMAVNQFADWSEEEFSAIRSTRYQSSMQAAHTVEFDSKTPRPASMDWRSKGVVTPVKNQGCSAVNSQLHSFVAAACSTCKCRAGKLMDGPTHHTTTEWKHQIWPQRM